MSRPIRTPQPADLVCFSHLRWNFVFQRPQHLLTRCARDRRVFYVEEPFFDTEPTGDWLEIQRGPVTRVVPHLPRGCSQRDALWIQWRFVRQLMTTENITEYLLWYYTPMALSFTLDLKPQAIVYDCMDELSAFAMAPAGLKGYEAELLRRATLVFTGGQSLYEAKRDAHPNVMLFPSSVDVAHFAQARTWSQDPPDQRSIPTPRLGFFGVIDERMDIELLAGIAAARPDWHLVMVGPVVKIDPATLPRARNIHYLSGKSYQDLPHYIAGWDVALLPFARNDATRYISPTKTPEYLAAGRPVVSTSIRDVVRPYGQRGLVRIADTVERFVRCCEEAMGEDAASRMQQADAFLRQTSWDGTWAQMHRLIEDAVTVSTDAAPATRAV